jgi:hemerythrin
MEQRNIPEEWLNEYNVNIAFIDEQHQYFFKVLKSLEAIVKTKSCQDNISGIFFAMVHYADHFLIQEEIYFKSIKYPGLNEHHLKHNVFVEGIINLKNDFASGEKNVCHRLLSFMTDYFHDHILGYDRKTVEYLKENSIKL